VIGAAIGSFRLKLVLYFVLLALLPLGALVWGLGSLVSQNETHRVDARLQAGLRAAVAAYEDRVAGAQRRAELLARSRPLQVDLERGDVPALKALVHGRPGLEVVGARGAFRVGRADALSAQRRVAVLARSRLVGTVIASVPFDASLAAALRARSGLDPSDRVALLHGGHIVASAPTLVGTLVLPAGRTATARVGDVDYRALVAPASADTHGVRFAVLSPQSRIDTANAATRNRLLLALLAALLVVGFVAYAEGRSIVRTLRALAEAAQGIARGRFDERVPVRGRDEFALLGNAFNEMAGELQERVAELEAERSRLRDAITRFGEALAATHDVDQLLRVIVEAAVEATGATGAVILTGAAEAHAGSAEQGAETLQLPLTLGREELGTLMLTGPEFNAEQRMTAASLASHAAVALENARLHRIVERQALIDELTGIGNRRRCEEALSAEVARSERFRTPFTIVLADLDDFKAVNDEYGHPVGDTVLRRLARVLDETIRESDVVGRWGGEEFLLLLPGTDAAGGAQLAERMRSRLARSGEPTVTCSFGVAQHPAGAGSPEELFAAADRALYEAKRRGKNRVEVDAAVQSF
jgi:diguanylate cyclase (GGDEF)-like protein